MEIAMKSHVGRVRQINEDYYACVADLNGRVLAIVADGMGGHQAGDIASRLAVERIVKELRHLDGQLDAEDAREQLMNAVLLANREVYDYAVNHPECSGMGTTVVAALLGESSVITAHIGDSRLYFYNADGLVMKTEDHSLVNELLKSGQITEEEASVHPHRNVIMRSLGTEPDVLIDLGQFEWSEGDVVLICSDGLTNKVGHASLENWLQKQISLQAKVDGLVQEALDAGGEDNITLVAVQKKLDVGQKEG
ncbi:protein phosphatase PrpC [Brevibacillus agri]|uniref:Protein phosphatase PrpC n=1 Tax=Brevibacillus agri TaxID=51101 RepID=A0A3M8AZ43_9BACL|nr:MULTISPECIES: Stp1/IreP family PP2C-type Ser/Thr phosphatase [Brevibacillus]ELK41800.1 protein phosphatase [Brevibacillus agri BAB-2500]MBG9564944.1 serine/threonine protein phosphatase [Brevibacillus agri]MBY0054022.1 Stp1/IreP family PP2C-type Ser/Thr phosphatase [Brevibacillus agri]MCG5251476.1 Stp1/IreP family PP2C-type Ser/Thr phosphatase [Brevibacillus agri]MDN4093104.1 Stp1/IreP family PP2C-type Ser/Thr phosphatase [Brevibacillus agri]